MRAEREEVVFLNGGASLSYFSLLLLLLHVVSTNSYALCFCGSFPFVLNLSRPVYWLLLFVG